MRWVLPRDGKRRRVPHLSPTLSAPNGAARELEGAVAT